MATPSDPIPQLATDWSNLQGQLNTFLSNVKTFIASATSGSSGTTLSTADAASLATIDQQVTAAETAINSITIPTPSTSTSSSNL